MTDIDKTRAHISAIIDEIAATQKALGFKTNEPSDREAYDIICRIERKLAQAKEAPAA